MDSSFLTFSPKALSRKKLSGNIVQGPVRSRILRSKICPLQDVHSSPSSLHNIEKNHRVSLNSKKSSPAVNDSVVIIHENVNCETPTWVPKLLNRERRSKAKNTTSISSGVRNELLHSDAKDKFDEIRSWLDELHTAHERKKWSSPWSSANSSSIIECSPVSVDPPNLDIKNTSKNRIPETSSEESIGSLKQKNSPGSVYNYNSQELDKQDIFKGKNTSKNRISETSSDESIGSLKQKNPSSSVYNCNSQELEKQDISKEIISGSSDDERVNPARRKKVCLIFSDSECDDAGNYSSHSSSAEKKTDLISSKSSEHSFKLLPYKKSDCSESSSRPCSHSDDSIISVSSADRIISDLYAKNWNKESVLTPVLGKRKTVTKKLKSEEDICSIDFTLTQVYGKSWDEEKVLTPLLNRKARGGKENTPPANRKEVNGVRPFLTPSARVIVNGIRTPKACSATKGNSKNTKSHETLSFLRSLSACSPKKCNLEALVYKKEFKKNKDELCTRLFKLFNAEVFDNKLPYNLRIDWNVRMNRTAGFCRNSSVLGSQGKIRSSRIELSTKVCNTADRIRDTLIHELCHAASWIVDGVKSGHGVVWQAWTKKAMTRFPELPRIGRCHSYSIDTKYTYKCKNCGYSFGRHSKSLDLQRKRCGYCYGEFDLLVNTKIKNANAGAQSTPKAPRTATGFALYVKENYKTTKGKNAGLKHAEIMKLLGNQFAGMKIGSSQQV